MRCRGRTACRPFMVGDDVRGTGTRMHAADRAHDAVGRGRQQDERAVPTPVQRRGVVRLSACSLAAWPTGLHARSHTGARDAVAYGCVYDIASENQNLRLFIWNLDGAWHSRCAMRRYRDHLDHVHVPTLYNAVNKSPINPRTSTLVGDNESARLSGGKSAP